MGGMNVMHVTFEAVLFLWNTQNLLDAKWNQQSFINYIPYGIWNSFMKTVQNVNCIVGKLLVSICNYRLWIEVKSVYNNILTSRNAAEGNWPCCNHHLYYCIVLQACCFDFMWKTCDLQPFSIFSKEIHTCIRLEGRRAKKFWHLKYLGWWPNLKPLAGPAIPKGFSWELSPGACCICVLEHGKKIF